MVRCASRGAVARLVALQLHVLVQTSNLQQSQEGGQAGRQPLVTGMHMQALVIGMHMQPLVIGMHMQPWPPLVMNAEAASPPPTMLACG